MNTLPELSPAQWREARGWLADIGAMPSRANWTGIRIARTVDVLYAGGIAQFTADTSELVTRFDRDLAAGRRAANPATRRASLDAAMTRAARGYTPCRVQSCTSANPDQETRS